MKIRRVEFNIGKISSAMLKKFVKNTTLALAFIITSQALSAAKISQKPNIVLLFVDDMGWSDMSYRNRQYETPNIDLLVSESIDFTQAYIPTPTCSPSRASLLTGQYAARLHMVRHIPDGAQHGFDKFGRTERQTNLWAKDPAKVPSVNWLATEHVTYAEALNDLGYFNQFIGKWHLGHEPYHPEKQGFDNQIGSSNMGHPKSYYPPYFKNSAVFVEEKQKYLTDKLTDESVNFIKTYNKKQPFMLSLWYYTVHGPHIARQDLLKHFKSKGLTGDQARYAAMLKAMDESVGRVRQALQEKGLDKETVLIFLSDQGGMFDNAPLRGGKRHDTLYEGGARVPFIVRWPGVTTAAKNSSIVHTPDLFPTLVEMAGGDARHYKKLDGISLLPILKSGEKLQRKSAIFGYRAYEDLYASVREGDWKLLAYRSGTLKLYNITKDQGEAHDIAQAHPEIVALMKQQLIAHEKEIKLEKYSGVR